MSERQELIKAIKAAFRFLEPLMNEYPPKKNTSGICNETDVYLEDMPIEEVRDVADCCRSRLRMRNLDRAMRSDFNAAALHLGLTQPFPDATA